jgi:LPXTG-motif cell wall-anchored protein
MELLFIIAAVAVFGGAAFLLTRKKKNNYPTIGGGYPTPSEPNNDGTVNPPKNGDEPF